jgi:hypothetical protein
MPLKEASGGIGVTLTHSLKQLLRSVRLRPHECEHSWQDDQPTRSAALPFRALGSHQLTKTVEKVATIVRPRRRFRVVLHAKGSEGAVPQPSDRVVVQVAMCDVKLAWQSQLIHRKTMVLRRYLNPSS